MKLYIKSRANLYEATGEYNLSTKKIKVLKGSVLSQKVYSSMTFDGSRIEKMREGVVENGKLIEDVEFSSPSTAANFVTGRSTNGLITWENKEGLSLKQLLSDK